MKLLLSRFMITLRTFSQRDVSQLTGMEQHFPYVDGQMGSSEQSSTTGA